MIKSLKTAGIALAVGTLALSVPASAAPGAYSTGWHDQTPAYGDMVFEHGRHHKRGHGHRAYGNRGYAAQPYYNQYSSYDGQQVHRNTRVWQGDDGRYYCRKENGTTGLLVGAGVGALIGHEVAGRGGDRTLGAILGAAGGALLGRTIDRSSTRCR